jgi:hypothetical protein
MSFFAEITFYGHYIWHYLSCCYQSHISAPFNPSHLSLNTIYSGLLFAIYFSTVLWCFTKVRKCSILVVSSDCKLKVNIFVILLLYYWSTDYNFSDHPVVLSAELAPCKYCNSSAIPGPVTKNKLHIDITKINDLMTLSLRSKICRTGKVISPIYLTCYWVQEFCIII